MNYRWSLLVLMVGVLFFIIIQPMLAVRPMDLQKVAPSLLPLLSVDPQPKTMGDIRDEFNSIREWSSHHIRSQSCDVARSPENIAKNRYHDVLALDKTRVRLQNLDTQHSDYINANEITFATNSTSSAYISCQAPLPSTMNDFWRMVWEQETSLIVMLTNCIEKGREKAQVYWPDVVGMKQQFGDIVVHAVGEKVHGNMTIRSFNIFYLSPKNGEVTDSRSVLQIHYTEWGDMGVPDSPHAMTDLLKIVHLYTNISKTTTSPIVVHCSAGIGRSGTFIAINEAVKQLNSSYISDVSQIDIKNIVLQLRKQRVGMVQTFDQFVFIYKVLFALGGQTLDLSI